METDDVDDSEDEDEYSDDDDMSWKVRRAAAKCLQAVILTRHEMLADFYRIASPTLIARYLLFYGEHTLNIFVSYFLYTCI